MTLWLWVFLKCPTIPPSLFMAISEDR
jgi:hypothetical protein